MRQRLIIIVYLMLSLSTFAQINIWEGEAGRPKVGTLVAGEWHHSLCAGLQDSLCACLYNPFPLYLPRESLSRFRYVKSHAKEYNIDPDKIGAMGFSAGGHLVMSSVELFEKDDWPAFVVPVYPVVTMTASCVHKRSRRGLLGDSRVRNKELRELLSMEKHVPSDCPPVFLINCKDDPIVDYHNSILLDSALTSQKIPHQYLLYETGGHGFGASDIKGTPECRQWKEEFIKWINKIL